MADELLACRPTTRTLRAPFAVAPSAGMSPTLKNYKIDMQQSPQERVSDEMRKATKWSEGEVESCRQLRCHVEIYKLLAISVLRSVGQWKAIMFVSSYLSTRHQSVIAEPMLFSFLCSWLREQGRPVPFLFQLWDFAWEKFCRIQTNFLPILNMI